MHLYRLAIFDVAAIRRYLFMVAISVLSVSCSGQSLSEFSYESYGVENDTINVIQNVTHLERFFQSLYELKTGGRERVSILHIGDSHVQGDYFTQPIRRNIQLEFGNAGRGLIVPGRVAGTNESYNIRTSSDVEWMSKRCVHPDRPLPIGIGGITISTASSGKLDILMKDPTLNYSFDEVKLFYQRDSLSYDFVLRDSLSNQLTVIPGAGGDLPYGHAHLLSPVEAISLQLVRRNALQSRATLFGISLEKSDAGVLYHSIGVNGAKYKHYNAAAQFAPQTAALEPALIIVSLGTNEALDYPYLDNDFAGHVAELIGNLQKHNPNALFILTTPPPGFRRQSQHNPGLEEIRTAIIQFAAENGLAFWDMHKIMGGDEGARRLTELELMRPDGIHASKAGYEYMGNLFYHALMRGYNGYVLQLRP